MKKKSLIFGILLLGVVFTASRVSGTYARYITTDSGTGTATVAKWHAEVTGFSDAAGSKTITLSPVANQYVASGLIAPDADAAGILTVDLTGTQVAVDITGTLGTLTVNNTTVLNPADHFDIYLKVYNSTENDANITNGTATALATLDTTTPKYFIPLSGSTISKNSVKVAVLLHWKHSDTTEGWNSWDTSLGEYETQAPTITATINLTAQQHIAADDPVVTP